MADEMILEYLRCNHAGEENAATSKELEVAFSLSNRKIRHVVSNLRGKNHPVCSSDRGYFYSDKPEEITRCIRQLEHRAKKITKVKNGLKKALQSLEQEGKPHEISLFEQC